MIVVSESVAQINVLTQSNIPYHVSDFKKPNKVPRASFNPNRVMQPA